ncbi:MAG: PaREP1 family protein [Desulfurococcaceae archaeon]
MRSNSSVPSITSSSSSIGGRVNSTSAERCIEEALVDFSNAVTLVEDGLVREASERLYGAAVKAIVALALQRGLRLAPVELCSLSSNRIFEDPRVLEQVTRIAAATSSSVRSSWDSVVALRSLVREGGARPEDVKIRAGVVEDIISEAQSIISYSTIKTHIEELRREVRAEIEGLKSSVEETLRGLSEKVEEVDELDKKISMAIRVLWPVTVALIIATIIITRLFLR